jgi:hypothetical protein
VAEEPRVVREPVLGWRAWRCGIRSPWLYSLVKGYRWVPDRNEATGCRRVLGGRHVPPGRGCGCGFWGLWRWDKAFAAGRVGAAVGLVYGWGGVAIHGDEGFRAQYARVVCLFTDNPWSPIFDRLAGRAPSDAFRFEVTRNRPLLEPVAGAYRVPLLCLADAARSGALGEFGVPRDQIHEIQSLGSWIV